MIIPIDANDLDGFTMRKPLARRRHRDVDTAIVKGETVVSTVERSARPGPVGLTVAWTAKYGRCARCGEELVGKKVRALLRPDRSRKVVCTSCVATSEWLDAVNAGRILDLARGWR